MAYHNGDGRVLDGSVAAVRASHDAPREFPELDCLNDRLTPAVRAAVERRAIEVGVGADRVLIAFGLIDEDDYIEALAHWLGLEPETFEHCTRKSCPLDDRYLMIAARTGLLPLVVDGALALVLAPRSVRAFLTYVSEHPNVRFRLTSAARLNAFIGRCGRDALGHQAADALSRTRPQLSAGTRRRGPNLALAAMAACAGGAAVIYPEASLQTFSTFCTVIFMSWLALRIFGSCLRHPLTKHTHIADHELPIYTIIVALYREAETVDELVASLRKIDYPGLR